jgi:Subtilase family
MFIIQMNLQTSVPRFTTIVLATLLFACPLSANEPTAATWVADEIIVGFHEPPGIAEYIAARRVASEIRHWRELGHCGPDTLISKQHPLGSVRVFALSPGADVIDVARRLNQLGAVAYAHPNYITHPAFEPNDPFYAIHQYAPVLMNAPDAWDLSTGSDFVLVAVADSGLNLAHQEFQQNVWTNNDSSDGIDSDANGYVDDHTGWDFINSNNDVTDIDGHGTHVAGIIAAGFNNSVGIAGMARCTVMPLKVFEGSQGTWEAIAQAIYYAVDNGADMVNYSGGGFGGDGLLADAVTYAWNHDVPVIAASGNHGTSIPFFPAAYPEAIAVSATGPNDTYYTPSGRGDYLDVAAPGITILSTDILHFADYQFMSGTSMATAQVTGLVALMSAINPDLGVEEIRTLLRENAVDLGSIGPDEFYGYGRIDALATLLAVPSDATPPMLIAEGPLGPNPFDGYIDPRAESTNGVLLDLGVFEIELTFSEPVRNVSGAPLTTDAFTISGTSDNSPDVFFVDDSANPTVRLLLSTPIPVEHWTTITASVEDFSGNLLLTSTPDGGSPADGITIGFLPGDVDQNGMVSPFDLLAFREIVAGVADDLPGAETLFVDTDRNEIVEPFDLLRYRGLIFGAADATRAWQSASLPDAP